MHPPLISPASTAGETVMNLPDLLHIIFLHLDIRTALTAAQRVCRTWHRIITTTPEIQRALFFLPDENAAGPPSTSDDSPSTRRRLVQNPLLAELFPAWFDGSPPESPITVPADTLIPDISNVGNVEGHRWEPFHACAVSRNRRGFLYDGASWRRMLVTQPPTRRFGTVLHGSRAKGAIHKFDGSEQGLPPCSCRIIPRHPFVFGLSFQERSKFFAAQDSSPVMRDGLRMGTFYDTVQHFSYQKGKLTTWRFLWEFDEAMFKKPDSTDGEAVRDVFTTFGLVDQYRSGGPRVRLTPMASLIRLVFDESDGPVLLLFEQTKESHDDDAFKPLDYTTLDELQFQVQFRFPMGSGLVYAEFWHNGDRIKRSLGFVQADEKVQELGKKIQGGTMADVEAFDRELDQRDEAARDQKRGSDASVRA